MIISDGKDYKFDDMGHRVIFEDDGYRYHAECKRYYEDCLMYKSMREDNHLLQFHIERTHHIEKTNG